MSPTLEDEAFDELEKRLHTQQQQQKTHMSGQSANQQKLRDHLNNILLAQSADHQPSTTDHGSRADDRQVGGTHYKNMTVSPWDVVDTWPIEQQVGYYRGNALKYIMRCGAKDGRLQEVKKAGHYIEKLTEILQEPTDNVDSTKT